MSMGIDMMVIDIAEQTGLDHSYVSNFATVWIKEGVDFADGDSQEAFLAAMVLLSDNNRYSVYHCDFNGVETHEVVDAPTVKDAVKGLSIFKNTESKHMLEFFHGLPHDVDGIRQMFWDCDETISIFKWGRAN